MSICDDCPAKVTTYAWQQLCVLGEDMELEVFDGDVVPQREDCNYRKVMDLLVEAKEIKGLSVESEESLRRIDLYSDLYLDIHKGEELVEFWARR